MYVDIVNLYYFLVPHMTSSYLLFPHMGEMSDRSLAC